MKKRINKIDEMLSEKLGNYQSEVLPEDWDAISASLDKQKRRPAGFWSFRSLLFLAPGLLVAGSGLAFILHFSQLKYSLHGNANEHAAATKSTSVITKTTKHTIIEAEDGLYAPAPSLSLYALYTNATAHKEPENFSTSAARAAIAGRDLLPVRFGQKDRIPTALIGEYGATTIPEAGGPVSLLRQGNTATPTQNNSHIEQNSTIAQVSSGQRGSAAESAANNAISPEQAEGSSVSSQSSVPDAQKVRAADAPGILADNNILTHSRIQNRAMKYSLQQQLALMTDTSLELPVQIDVNSPSRYNNGKKNNKAWQQSGGWQLQAGMAYGAARMAASQQPAADSFVHKDYLQYHDALQQKAEQMQGNISLSYMLPSGLYFSGGLQYSRIGANISASMQEPEAPVVDDATGKIYGYVQQSPFISNYNYSYSITSLSLPLSAGISRPLAGRWGIDASAGISLNKITRAKGNVLNSQSLRVDRLSAVQESWAPTAALKTAWALSAGPSFVIRPGLQILLTPQYSQYMAGLGNAGTDNILIKPSAFALKASVRWHIF